MAQEKQFVIIVNPVTGIANENRVFGVISEGARGK